MTFSAIVRQLFARCGLLLSKQDHPAARYFELQPATGLTYALHRAFDRLHGRRFVQVGANDGQRHDPIADLIRTFNWSGTLIEPRGVFVRQLQMRHGRNPSLRILQAAIAERKEDRFLYFIDPSVGNLPLFAGGLATLDRARIETACRDLGLPPGSIKTETVRCLTWQDLATDIGLEKTEILVLDAEGYDITLLRLWDWSRVRPKVVHFEHACSPPQDYVELIGKLRALGYEMATDGGDTTLFLPNPT